MDRRGRARHPLRLPAAAGTPALADAARDPDPAHLRLRTEPALPRTILEHRAPSRRTLPGGQTALERTHAGGRGLREFGAGEEVGPHAAAVAVVVQQRMLRGDAPFALVELAYVARRREVGLEQRGLFVLIQIGRRVDDPLGEVSAEPGVV